MTAQRNVLFLIADDWSRIAGCYGHGVVQTPRIDSFAHQSAIFDQAFCTSPSCAVSRACVLTGYHSHTHGQYGHCHGIHGFSTHPHITSTPSSLKEHGYATACIGKKHVEPPSVYPFDFEPRVNARNGVELARAARDFWAAHPDQPFYMHVGFSDPHRAGRGFGNERPYPDMPATQYRPADVVVPPYLPDVPDVRADLAEYYQAVSRFDFGVGCLLDALAESGRADETLVIVTTDHAMPFPGAKASFFDSGHHCPFILRAPGLTAPGTRSQSLVNWTDIRPTLHEWCGVPAPDDLPGRSLLPGLADPSVPDWDHTFFSHCFHEVVDYNPYRVLRGRRYKFVRNLAAGLTTLLPTDLFRSATWTAVRRDAIPAMGERPTRHLLAHAPEELYDLEADPTESVNRIDDPHLQEVAAQMRAQLYQFRRATADPWLEVDFQEGRIDRLEPR